ncbi:hypothetical protein [Novosphingobium mathurense]|uniref:Transcriptional regulator, AlpA family n=1 Tax=Novosphingobium mathurense TaxID=428990 RepID=A0A1U6I7S2_9SPHN|nr:hypothetical protein [Novosphingobium mathurense]SLK04037.1 hypothetical protein SAMN06295987_104327 [Novosphingobium mathurense]
MTRWPALMKRKTAAEYCDLSEQAFLREVASGRLPPAVLFGGRDHWHKEALDRALALLCGEREDDAEAEFWRRTA